MSIQDALNDILFATLPRKREENDELHWVIEMVRKRSHYSVVVDFSRVDVVGGRTFNRLLELRQLLQNPECMLILCSVAPATMGVFTIVRLDEVFDFTKDRFAALARFRTIGSKRYT